jgi:ketosteroid isomerase-like protein
MSVLDRKYVVVWKKQKGGSWKAEADIFNTDK